ncbi:MAG: hypothetical protein KC431_26590, partial [Myxococcales bacterium]|nr:hypothetical protein [Myxococcales bacterium]
YQRWVWLALLQSNEPWEQRPEDMLYFMNDHSDLTPDEAAKVPRSKEFKKKFKELEKATAAVNAFNRKRSQRQFERALKMTEQFGDFGMQLEVLGDGLGVHGSWRYAKGFSPIEVGINGFLMGSMDDDWTEYERLNQESYRIQDELRMIRMTDLDAAAAKQKGTSK